MYPIKSLASKANVSEQSIRNLLKNNTELVELAKANTIKNGRFIKYGEPVLEWILNYYNIEPSTENEVGESIVEPTAEVLPQSTAPTRPTEADLVIELSSIRAENEALKTAIEALKTDLEREREEKKEIREQLGISLLALRQEQEEKKLYLPAPRKTLRQFFKGLFSKK